MKQCWTLLRVVSPSALILLQAAIAASAPCSGPVCLLYGRDPWKAQLNCSIALDDEQLITWTNLTGDAGSLTAVSGEGEPIEAETEAVFTVTDPSDDRVNFFRCRIGDQSQDFTVVYPIRFGKFPRSHFVTEGEDFELVCNTTTFPAVPSVTWLVHPEGKTQKNSTEITVDTDGTAGKSQPHIAIWTDTIKNDKLKIEDTVPADRMWYTCVAENKYDLKNVTTLLRVKDKNAALWPFLGIVAEVVTLCIVILVCERRRAAKEQESQSDDDDEDYFNGTSGGGEAANSSSNKVRHRK